MPRKIPDRLLPHKNTSYKPFIGNGNNGRLYGPSVPVDRALVAQKNTLVRNAQGEQVTSGTQVYADQKYVFPVNSLYTVWAGTPRETESTVISVAVFDDPQVQGLIVVYLE